jgi:hypothetical protein
VGEDHTVAVEGRFMLFELIEVQVHLETGAAVGALADEQIGALRVLGQFVEPARVS